VQTVDTLLTLAGLLAFFVVLVLLAARFRAGRLDTRALWLAPCLWLINAGTVLGGRALQFHYFAGSGLKWNWLGKILAIGVTLLCCRLLPDFDRRRAGITWRQAPGSFWPTLAVIVVACVGAACVQRMLEIPDTRPETFLFQLFMPTLDEELFYRGLLTFYLARALGDSLSPKAWIPDVSAWIIALQFSFAHAFGVDHSRPMFSITTFLGVLFYGSLFAWARQRTGSVILPMVTHTLANTLFRVL
jgi:membrane protease YdiL (CAAX protease family)